MTLNNCFSSVLLLWLRGQNVRNECLFFPFSLRSTLIIWLHRKFPEILCLSIYHRTIQSDWVRAWESQRAESTRLPEVASNPSMSKIISQIVDTVEKILHMPNTRSFGSDTESRRQILTVCFCLLVVNWQQVYKVDDILLRFIRPYLFASLHWQLKENGQGLLRCRVRLKNAWSNGHRLPQVTFSRVINNCGLPVSWNEHRFLINTYFYLHVYRFPIKDPVRMVEWLKLCPPDISMDSVMKGAFRLCSKHFRRDQYLNFNVRRPTLVHNAVPFIPR